MTSLYASSRPPLYPPSLAFNPYSQPHQHHPQSTQQSPIMPIDHGNDIILLTCANGKPCNQLIPFLLPKRKRLRLAVSNDSSRQQLLEKYAGESKAQIEVVLADLTQPDDCKRILEGITAVYHVKPTFHPRETKIGSNIPLLTRTNSLADQLPLQLSHDQRRSDQQPQTLHLLESPSCTPASANS